MSMPSIRWLLVACLAGGLAAAATQAPRLLRGIAYFRVDRVEVIGTRHLPPHEILALSGIDSTSSVFDDREPWHERLLGHLLVSDVTIQRRLPGTVLITVRETEPVLLARTPELTPVDGQGNVLPIDPARGSLDLPVLLTGSEVGPDLRLADPSALALVMAYDRVRRLDPSLATRVSEVHPEPGGMRLLLREPGSAEALLPTGAGPIQLRQIELVLRHLASTGELDRARRLDARFRDQVVVSLGERPGVPHSQIPEPE